jgi:glycosyltransferase involved in cell wall biosynthesis
MYKENKIGVIVPAYNEELLIQETLEGMPEIVDRIFVIDDGSSDNTPEIIKKRQQTDQRIILIENQTNQGLGQSLINGYLASRKSDIDITVVMAGDNQMHPDDLRPLVAPIVSGESDYVCGDRLAWPSGWRAFPRVRLGGVFVLAALTRWVTGLDFIRDAQCGYTAVRVEALGRVDLDSLYPRYGFPNDLLAKATMAGLQISTRAVRPVYADEKSKLRIPRVVLPILKLMFSNWLARRRNHLLLPSSPTPARPVGASAESRVEDGWAGEPAA